MQGTRGHVLLTAGRLVAAGAFLLAGCGEKESASATRVPDALPVVFPDSLSQELPLLNQDLPPGVAKEVAALLEKEEKWIVSPPKDRTPSQLDQDFADLRWEVARRFGRHDVKSAISYARASLSLDEAHPQRWELLGDWYSMVSDPASLRAAANAYDNATFLNPSAPGPHRKLAAAHMMLKQHREAMAQFEYCLALADEKEERELVPLYAAECAAAGEFKRGIIFCQKIAETNPNPQFRLAWAIFEKAAGNPDAAIKLLAEIEKAEPKDSAFAECAVALRMRYEKEKGGVK